VPLQNRVTPLGELIATPHRGLVYGNRGCLHDAHGRIARNHATRRWISCRLAFKGWHRAPLVQPGRFTELFFLDEATAFAAGHRPCALCRREDYNRFCEIVDVKNADAIDLQLHHERLEHRARRLHRARVENLPDGAFVIDDGAPHLVVHGQIRRWSPAGYGDEILEGPGTVRLLTPPTLVEVLRAGWDGAVPLLHPSAALVR
jgi:PAS domain-containing protein